MQTKTDKGSIAWTTHVLSWAQEPLPSCNEGFSSFSSKTSLLCAPRDLYNFHSIFYHLGSLDKFHCLFVLRHRISGSSGWPYIYYRMRFWTSAFTSLVLLLETTQTVHLCQGSNSGLCACYLSTLQTKPHPQSCITTILKQKRHKQGNLSTWRSFKYSMTLKELIS